MRLKLVLFNVKEDRQNIEEFEDLYQEIIGVRNGDKEIPLKYKAEFMFNLFDIFCYNGGYTRCRLLMEIFKELFEANKTNDYVAFKYYSAYLSVDYKYATLTFKTPEEYIGDIFKDINSRAFPQEVATDLEFKKDMLLANYYSVSDPEKWMSISDKLLDTCQSTRLLYLMKDFVIRNYHIISKPDEELGKQVRRILPVIKEELKTHPEPELADSFLWLLMVDLIDCVQLKDKEEVVRLAGVIDKFVEHHRFTKSLKLYYKIMISMHMFTLDPESVDQGKIFGFKKEFEELVSGSTYEMNYSMMDGFGFLVNIQELMGVQIDYQIAKNYADLIKDDKLSYICFVSSLESISDPTMKPYIETALEYCDELEIDKLHEFRINLDYTNIMTMMAAPEMQGMGRAMEELDSLAELYEQNLNIVTKEKLVSIYLAQIMIAKVTGLPQKYVQVALKFLPTQTSVDEIVDEIYDTTITNLSIEGDIAKAGKLSTAFLAYAKKDGENTHTYYKALKTKIKILSKAKLRVEALQISTDFERIASDIYGEGSLEHADSIKTVSQLKSQLGNYQEAYQGFLNCYDMYKAKFGSEVNPESSSVLVRMAVVKKHLEEFEDAFNLLDKAKQVEEKTTSKFSKEYKLILRAEEFVQVAVEKPEYNRKEIFTRWPKTSKSKISSALVGICLVAFGVYYYIKNKKSG
ncbi:unnamed protein product [Moneuplotes crassus]|uniref:Uncharacterized protein n=1 Tax=Euplotes crassus TaxID=5936 RepID=A0AAD1U301_EUPCR|nr:unnamed protein product [Moneuplotes crassus]